MRNYRSGVLDMTDKERDYDKYDSALILPAGLLNVLLCFINIIRMCQFGIHVVSLFQAAIQIHS